MAAKMALQACRKLLQAIEAAKEVADDGNDIETTFTIDDEDKIIIHTMDCIAVLATMQSKQKEGSADARTSRNKVFMAALSIAGH